MLRAVRWLLRLGVVVLQPRSSHRLCGGVGVNGGACCGDMHGTLWGMTLHVGLCKGAADLGGTRLSI